MPFLIRWPGIANPDIQGRSLLPVLKNDGIAPADWRKGIDYAYYGETTHHVAAHDGVRSDRYKLFYIPQTKEWQLFDLEKDPQEMKDLHDNPEYAGVLAKMKKLYQDLRTQYQVK